MKYYLELVRDENDASEGAEFIQAHQPVISVKVTKFNDDGTTTIECLKFDLVI